MLKMTGFVNRGMDLNLQETHISTGFPRLIPFLSVCLTILIQSAVLQHFLVGALDLPMLYRAIFYGALILIGLHWGIGIWTERNLPIPLPLLVFYGLCLLSMSWAQEAHNHIDTLVLYSLALIAGSWCACWVNPTKMLTYIAIVGIFVGFLLLYNIFSAELDSGSADRMRHSLISGVFQHKNHLGRFAVLAVVASVLSAVYLKKPMLLLVAAFYLWVLSLANSAGAVMAMAFSIWFLLGAMIFSVRPPWFKGFVLLSLLGLLLVFVFSGTLLELLGRTPNLTGRTVIWQELIPLLRQSPFFGQGFGGYAEGVKSLSGLAGQVSDAHNGLLELLVVLGIAGLLLFLWAIAVFAVRVVKLPRGDAIILLFMVAFFLFQNIYESLIFKKLDVYWFLFCYALCRVHVVYKNESKS